MARGKFICFLDIDDRWLPQKLWAQAERLDENPELRLLYSTYIRARRAAVRGKVRQAPPLLKPQHSIRFANPVPMLTACVNRESITGIYFEPCHHEDYLFWHAVMERLQPEEIGVEPSPLAIYCVHNASVSSNKFKAAGWYWTCYERLGYSKAHAISAMLARTLLEAWILLREAFAAKILLSEIK
jgi:hypothetical protein